MLTVVGLGNEHGGVHEVGVVLQVVGGGVAGQHKHDAGRQGVQGRVQPGDRRKHQSAVVTRRLVSRHGKERFFVES